MGRYQLSVYSGGDGAHEGPSMSPEQMQEMMQKIFALEAELDAAGAWVFGGRLDDSARVVRVAGGVASTTDGPYVETKEHIAGFYIIEAADDATALDWAGKVTDAVGAPIEVRAFAATGRAADHVPPGA